MLISRKKMVCLLIFSTIMLFAATLQAAPTPEAMVNNGWDPKAEKMNMSTGEKILWYIPNRLSDLMDIFTVEIGAPELGVDLQLTRWLAFGAGIGGSYVLGWSIYNQHGIYRQQGWYADFFRYRVSETQRDCICGFYQPFFRAENNLVDIGKMDKAKAEDPYALGIKACCLLGVKIQIHPVEIADFLAGIFLIDFRHDDNPKFNWVFCGIL